MRPPWRTVSTYAWCTRPSAILRLLSYLYESSFIVTDHKSDSAYGALMEKLRYRAASKRRAKASKIVYMSTQLEELEIYGARSVEDINELERTRLAVWMAKFAAFTMAAIVFTTLVAFIVTAFFNQSSPDTALMAGMFTNLHAIILAILGGTK